ncbi:MAG TPA: GAF domain-containing protein, partial [Candidatus Limnocylindrales bacterium]
MTRDDSAELAAARARITELEALEAQRARASAVQGALYRIAEAASAASDLQSFYRTIHGIVGELMYAENLYIALYDEEHERLNYPYYVDALDTDIPDPNTWEPFGVGQATGVTAYALRLGEPVFLDSDTYQRLHAAGEIEALGMTSDDSAWLGVPLRADGRLIGLLVAQSYSSEHPYTRADLDLLAFVGQHVASALTRARAIEETRQRNAELAVINEIGDALARQLDFQAIVELVGERIRILFDSRSMFIAIYDEPAGMIAYPYEIEDGQRYRSESIEFGPGLTSHVIRTRRPLRLHTSAESWAMGAIDSDAVARETLPATGEGPESPGANAGIEAESWLGVPILIGERVIGVIAMEEFEKHAFDESTERLLGTIATSMASALENARLFDETRRLLAETDERAAELAIVNEVQQGLAAQIEMQAMYDLVGDRLRDVFDAQVLDIGILDREAGLIHFPYTIERGVRFPDEPIPLMGIRKHVIETREPLLMNERVAERAVELGQPGVLQGEEPKSTMWAPLLVGGEATGVVSVQNLDREQAFSESDVRVLTTLAASLSVALENARLIHETRQRLTELATVNEIGQALASQLDLDPMYELVGDLMRNTFAADLVYVAMHDVETNRIEFAYYSENGVTRDEEGFPYGQGLTSHIIRTREPLLLNRDEAFEALEARMVGTPVKSYLGVPILLGDRAIGAISVQSMQEEGRFGAADVRLLGTIAASVGV